MLPPGREAVLLWFLSLQAMAAIILFEQRRQPRAALWYLGGLFAANAVGTTATWLTHGGAIRMPQDDLLGIVALAADWLGLWLLGAFLLALRPSTFRVRAAGIMLALGGAQVAAMAAYQWNPTWEVLFRYWFYKDWVPAVVFYWTDVAIPLHGAGFTAMVAIAVLILSRGAAWQRWLALAFLPRGMYWVAVTMDAVQPRHWLTGAPYLNWGAALMFQVQLLQIVPLAAGVWFLARTRPEQGPKAIIVVAVAAVGPLLALAEIAGVGRIAGRAGLDTFLNFATLALLRPWLTVVGVAPLQSGRLLARSVAAAAAGYLLMVSAPFLLGIEPGIGSRALGLGVAALTLGGIESWLPRPGADETGAGGPGMGPGTLVLDRYRVGPLLGLGTAGVVHAATDEVNGDKVVVKLLRPGHGTGDDVDRERTAMQAIRHANVVALREAGRSPWGAVLVMDHIDGGSLEAALHVVRFPLDAARIGDDLWSALEAVHDAGFLHRDVKPANVLLSRDGRAHLSDFNIAKVPDLDATLTGGEGHTLGTPRFMAPEVHADPGLASPASDIWSTAATLREVCQATDHRIHDSFWKQALAADPAARFADAATAGRAWARFNNG